MLGDGADSASSGDMLNGLELTGRLAARRSRSSQSRVAAITGDNLTTSSEISLRAAILPILRLADRVL